MVCNPPPGRLAAWLAPLALAAGCDGTISGIHRTRGIAPEVYAPPVSSAAQARADEPRQVRAQLLSLFVRQNLGSTIEHNGLGGSTAYWRKT